MLNIPPKPFTFTELLVSLEEKIDHTKDTNSELDTLYNLEVHFQLTYWSAPHVGIVSYEDHENRQYAVHYGICKMAPN